MKGGLLDVKPGLDRHIVEATFNSDGFWIFTFLDGKVCRETHVKPGDLPQEDTIKQLLDAPESAGHRWEEQQTKSGGKRWRRDDGMDIVYGPIDKTIVKHALTFTAPSYEAHLERIVADNGLDIAGDSPTTDEVRSRVDSTVRSTATRRNPIAGEKSPEYLVAYASTRYGIPLLIVCLVIRAWTRRVGRQTPVEPGSSRGSYYRRLCLKMSWRTVMIFVGAMFVVMLSQMSPTISVQQASEAGAIAFLLLLLFCPPTMLVTSWTQTKQKFAAVLGCSSYAEYHADSVNIEECGQVRRQNPDLRRRRKVAALGKLDLVEKAL
ncbi:MAG: hypothetical protein M3128_03520 [Verrucomicrobiota bacterium]|nr:hypothetical protein [Verrucomicrobiota bacterium]